MSLLLSRMSFLKGRIQSQNNLKKILLVMKLTIFLILVAFFQVRAEGYAQNVTLSANKIPMEKLFNQIKKQTGYIFFYDKALLKNARPVSIHVKNAPLDKVLDISFKDQPLSYKIVGQTIVVRNRPVVHSEELTKIKDESLEQEDAIEKVIRGRVTDEEGKPLAGVSVMLKGSSKGVYTNSMGRFNIEIESEEGVLVFSSVGYEAREIDIKDKVEIDVKLTLRVRPLDETIVVAYGKSKLKDLTGSISHLDERDMKNAPMGSTIQSMLQGKVTGVNVMIQSASPTSPVSVIVRGASSLSGDNQPLWVIDGVPQYAVSTSGNITNTLYNLNLDDVESVDVLKDASATALYGSRGASGVILVTTKHGKEGLKPTIDFTARYGTQIIDGNKVDVLVADQYIDLSKASVKEAIMSVGGLDYFTRQFIDEAKFNEKFKHTSHLSKKWITDDLFLDNAFLDGNTDWWSLMTRNASTQDYSLSLRGGTKQSSYYASAFMKDQQGIVKRGKSRTYGMRFNFESNIGDVLKLGLNVNANARNTSIKDAMLDIVLKMRPDFPAYNPDGSINRITLYTKNPLLELEDKNIGVGKTGAVTMYLEYNILKELKARTTGTVNYSHSTSDVFRKSQYDGDLNSRSISQEENTIFVWENTLNYFKTIQKHDINALLGFSMEEAKTQGLSASGSNFPDENVLINLGSAAIKNSINSSLTENSLVSAFARINYKFNNKYLVTGTVRQDGSSRFGPNKRWGFFPSAAVGWIISEEQFIRENFSFVSYLKLRASTGRTGSQNLGDYAWQTLMGSRMYNSLPGIIPSTLGNDILQWEAQSQIDVGIDYGFLNERIRGTLGWYQKKVNNLLYSDPVPTSSSFSTVTQNIGGLKNQGIEFDLKADLIRNKDFTFMIDFNIANNIGKLEKLNSTDTVYGGGAYQSYKVHVGGKLGEIYGYKYAGRLFQNQEEIIPLKNILQTGYLDFYRDTYENPGDVYIMDLNNDGKITVDDRTYLGNSNPYLFGGFGTTFIWKRIFLNATFTYAIGGKRLFDLEQRTSGDMNVYNVPTMALDSYTLKGDQGSLPRITYYGRGGNNIVTDRYIHDASFLRLGALNLSYRIADDSFHNSLFKTIEFTFQATNLFTITKYPGFDPQGNFSLSNSLIGTSIDYSTYPQAKTFDLGIKLTLH